MRLISVLLLVYLFSPCSSQKELIRLGTVEEINVNTKATNRQPLLVVQNIVYAIPADCFCNRDAGNNDSQRNSGKDDLARHQKNQSADREADSDGLGRNLGTDFIYREESSFNEGRDSGGDDSNRDLDVANSDRKLSGDADGRNLGNAANSRNSGNAADNRNSGNAAIGRNSGNAADGRESNSDNLARNFTTVHTNPACVKVKDSCSIEVIGFHPKAKIEYFDKIESRKAVEMVIKF